jgi:hypothetical protein
MHTHARLASVKPQTPHTHSLKLQAGLESTNSTEDVRLSECKFSSYAPEKLTQTMAEYQTIVVWVSEECEYVNQPDSTLVVLTI